MTLTTKLLTLVLIGSGIVGAQTKFDLVVGVSTPTKGGRTALYSGLEGGASLLLRPKGSDVGVISSVVVSAHSTKLTRPGKKAILVQPTFGVAGEWPLKVNFKMTLGFSAEVGALYLQHVRLLPQNRSWSVMWKGGVHAVFDNRYVVKSWLTFSEPPISLGVEPQARFLLWHAGVGLRF